jgi:hypothetical protein
MVDRVFIVTFLQNVPTAFPSADIFGQEKPLGGVAVTIFRASWIMYLKTNGALAIPRSKRLATNTRPKQRRVND